MDAPSRAAHGKGAPPAEDADDTDNDATDDESTAAEGTPGATRRTRLVRRRMAKNGSLVVLPLSMPQPSGGVESALVVASSPAVGQPTARIYLGPGNPMSAERDDLSRLIEPGGPPLPVSYLEITRIPLTMCLSKISAGDKARLLEAAPLLGCHIHPPSVHPGWVSHLAHPLRSHTHLVTPTVVPCFTAKLLSAWCLRRPIVTSDFLLKGLAGRKSISDPLPEYNAYAPEGGRFSRDSPAAEEEAGGESAPCGGRRDPLRGFLFVSLAPSEGESLVLSAGATLYRAYLLDDAAFVGGGWLDDLRAAERVPLPPGYGIDGVARPGGTVVLIDTASKRVKKRKEWLRRREVLGVTQKQLGAAINEMCSTLSTGDRSTPTVRGREGVPSAPFRGRWCSGESDKFSVTKSQEDSNNHHRQLSNIQELSREEVSRRQGSQRTITLNVTKPATEAQAQEQEQEPLVAPVDDNPPDEPEQMPSSQAKRKRGGRMAAVSVETGEAFKRAKKGHGAKEKDEIAEGSMVSSEVEESRRSRKMGTDDVEDEQVSQPTLNPNFNRKTLPRKQGGWLGVAPKNSKERAQYRSTKTDLENTGGDAKAFQSEPAITVKKRGLIVRSNEEVRQKQAKLQDIRGPRTVTGADGRPLKDFKRFRKNVFIPGSTSPIRFRSVLPRESERLRQLELAERELEKNEREAEELFHDRGGGIRSFFGTTAKKRVRGLRR